MDYEEDKMSLIQRTHAPLTKSGHRWRSATSSLAKPGHMWKGSCNFAAQAEGVDADHVVGRLLDEIPSDKELYEKEGASA